MSNRSYKVLLSVAVVGVLLAIMVFPLSLFAHDEVDDPDHVEADHTITYKENGTGAVRSFASTDPESAGIEWSIRGVDAADFEISSAGVLQFVNSPDYENPTDRARTAAGLNGNQNPNDPGETAFLAGDNSYQITVSATEVWNESDESLPAKRTDLDLTVVVQDVDDKGELVLKWLQPEVDTPITVALTDPDADQDGEITNFVWTWYTSKVADPEVGDESHWNVVADNLVTAGEPAATMSSYTPQGLNVDTPVDGDVAVDEGKYLRVKVSYRDPLSPDDDSGTTNVDESQILKSVYVKSANPVRAEVSSPGDNGSPDFVVETDTRTVPESTGRGRWRWPSGDGH